MPACAEAGACGNAGGHRSRKEQLDARNPRALPSLPRRPLVFIPDRLHRSRPITTQPSSRCARRLVGITLNAPLSKRSLAPLTHVPAGNTGGGGHVRPAGTRAQSNFRSSRRAGCESLRAIAAGPGGAGGIPAARGGKWSAVRVQRLLETAGWRLFETQVAILIATRADQPVCLLEYTLKSWAAGRALTEKTPPACWPSAVNSPSTVPAASLRGSV